MGENGRNMLTIWMFPKIGVFPPNHPILRRFFHYKPSILGYPYFWKHPYRYTTSLQRSVSRSSNQSDWKRENKKGAVDLWG